MSGRVRPPHRKQWQSHWSQLFDPGERDAAINSVIAAFYWLQDDEATQRRGRHDPQVFVSTLQELIVAPLCVYLEEVSARGLVGVSEGQLAAVRLIREVEDICDALANRKLLRPRVDRMIASLRTTWNEFIIAGAAHRMYHDLPREAETNKKRAEGGRLGAKSRQKIDPAKLSAKRAALVASGHAEHEIAGMLARHFGVTPDAVRKAMKKLNNT